ncbi:protein of unknown function (plasmid) [Caballeronia sp. S22]
MATRPMMLRLRQKTGLRTVGLLSGAFPEQSLRDAGCVAIYPGPAGLLANLQRSPLLA